MYGYTQEFVSEHFEVLEELLARGRYLECPQRLPGRYGRAVKAMDDLLEATESEAVLCGSWAVVRYGYINRTMPDLDVVLAADKIPDVLRIAPTASFDPIALPSDSWPKMLHRESGIRIDIIPERARPGTKTHSAPTTIPHPNALGAEGTALRYISLPGLVELKLAAGRQSDKADVIELIRWNPDAVIDIRSRLDKVHIDYVTMFDHFVDCAAKDEER